MTLYYLVRIEFHNGGVKYLNKEVGEYAEWLQEFTSDSKRQIKFIEVIKEFNRKELREWLENESR